MFFPERIENVKLNDRVLEIGPGGAPHPRADVLLEKKYKDEAIAEKQRGYAPEQKSNKKIVYYDGDEKFPFKDKEFDYVICSHVLEHISDVEGFIKEMFRVAKRGYLEYPLIYYDYLYNIPEHIMFLKINNGKLFYLPKASTLLSQFSEVNKLFYESLKMGSFQFVNDLKLHLFEGFEWSKLFEVQRANNLTELCWTDVKIDFSVGPKASFVGMLRNLKMKLLFLRDKNINDHC